MSNKNTNIVQVNPNQIIYRASALGSCRRALWAARNSYTPKPPPEQFQKIFARGHEIEEIVKSILKARNYIIINNQYEVHINLGPIRELRPVWILGHIDCDTSTTGDNYILTEIKGFGPDYLDKYLKTDIWAFPPYAYQISSYLHARTEKKWRFIIYQKTHDSDEDSFDRLIIRTYEEPPLTLKQLQNKVEEVEFLTTNDPSVVPCSGNYPCPYFYLHDDPNSVILLPNQVNLARAIKSFDAKIAKLEEVKDKFRNKLMKSLSTEMKYKATGFTVYFSDKPDRLDQRAVRQILREAGVPDDEYLVKGEGRQMNIREKKNDTTN